MPGAPWTAQSWLTGVIFSAVHAASGWSGLVALTALLFAASVLETLADEEGQPNPQQALLVRFAVEQARWALARADGGQ